MSALLTTTLPHMAETIALLKDEGLREQIKVMIGGAPVTAAHAEEIGADGYGANAGMAVERAKELVGQGKSRRAREAVRTMRRAGRGSAWGAATSGYGMCAAGPLGNHAVTAQPPAAPAPRERPCSRTMSM